MSDQATEPTTEKLVLDYELDAEPETVWRAISLQDHRQKWLARDAPADSDVLSVTPGRELSYRMRDDEPPFIESVVTFRISPSQAGGTRLRIIHEIADRRLDGEPKLANGNGPPMMLAA